MCRRFMRIVGGFITIPLHTVNHSIFNPCVYYYSLYGVFWPGFLLGLARLDSITCRRRFAGSAVVVTFDCTRPTGYTVDGYRVIDSVLQNVHVFWASIDGAEGSQ